MSADTVDRARIIAIATSCVSLAGTAALVWLSFVNAHGTGAGSLDLRGGVRPLSEISCATFRMPHCAPEAQQPLPI